jgi:hypothetical protein
MIGTRSAVLGTMTGGAFAILLATQSPRSAPPVSFVDDAARAGLSFVLQNHASPQKFQVEAMPAGVAVLDFDNDGLDDLYFVNGAALPGLQKTGPGDWNRLYRNNGDGTFRDLTEAAGVKAEGYSMGVAAADFDNDGWTDLFVAGVYRNFLFRNDGKGKFTDVTVQAGLVPAGPEKPWSIGAGWFDYNNDGLLDLFVVNYCKWAANKDPYCGDPRPGYRTYCHPKHYEGLPNQLYRNNGDGTFVDVSQRSLIGTHVGKGMGLAFADYDDDGFMDVFVANDTVRNFLFHNEANGTFTEVGLRAGIAFNGDGRALSSMGVDFRDVDNDGKPDLFITALPNETFTLHRNLGKGLFKDATNSSGLGLLSLPWGGWSTGIVDLNNDGWKDIFSANSDVMDNAELFSSRPFKQLNQIYVNVGGGVFLEAPAPIPEWRKARAHRGCAFGDFNGDGRLDVVVTSLNDPVELLRNTSDAQQHWIELLLTGVKSNRDAIGAKVRLTGASGLAQFNHVTTSVGYASSSSKRVHFGLGKDTRASLIEIRWPSGSVQVLKDVAADQVLKITETVPQ